MKVKGKTKGKTETVKESGLKKFKLKRNKCKNIAYSKTNKKWSGKKSVTRTKPWIPFA